MFERKPDSNEHCYISGYRLANNTYKEFKETLNIGMSKVERQIYRNEKHKVQSKIERSENIANRAWNTFPANSRLGDQEYKKAEDIQNAKIANPTLELTEKQQKLLERKARFDKCMDEFLKNNSKISDKEL
jgi:hypothetical protein